MLHRCLYPVRQKIRQEITKNSKARGPVDRPPQEEKREMDLKDNAYAGLCSCEQLDQYPGVPLVFLDRMYLIRIDGGWTLTANVHDDE